MVPHLKGLANREPEQMDEICFTAGLLDATQAMSICPYEPSVLFFMESLLLGPVTPAASLSFLLQIIVCICGEMKE